MALIRDREGRKGGGYERLFGDEALGHLISRVQAAVISSGTELERIIKQEVAPIEDLDSFLDQEIMEDGVFLVDKRQLKASTKLDFTGSEPDFVVFRRRNERQHCYVIELKDGDNFDTKKSTSEHRALHDYVTQNAPHLHFTVTSHICCFNQTSREEIVRGFKNRIPLEEAMTGREFCDLLEISYVKIVETRKKDQLANLQYFVGELTKIEAVREHFLYCLQKPTEEQRSIFN